MKRHDFPAKPPWWPYLLPAPATFVGWLGATEIGTASDWAGDHTGLSISGNYQHPPRMANPCSRNERLAGWPASREGKEWGSLTTKRVRLRTAPP